MTFPPPTAMLVDRCDRCGQQFPRTEPLPSDHAFCEPCRDALWRDERERLRFGSG